MATVGPNVLVEALPSAAGNVARERSFNGPVEETLFARLEQLGCFRDDSIGANDAAAAMKYQAIDSAAPVDVVAGRAGQIVGIVGRAFDTTTAGAITSGTITLRATIGGAAVGDAATLDSTHLKVESTFANPVSFVAGDQLGITLASASLAPTSSRGHCWLLVRWAPF